MFQLQQTETHLQLINTDAPKEKPVYIDFLHGKIAERKKRSSHQRELLLKACGVNAQKNLTIIDATAGYGEDAFMLAQHHCQVTMVERNPMLALLLADALARCLDHQWILLNQIKLVNMDAKKYLLQLSEIERPDVIYLDPMFPEQKKSALVKKEMQWLRTLAGDNSDAAELFLIAIKTAKKRVVVKRPHSAPFIHPDYQPTFQLNDGRTTRWDISTIIF